MNSEQRELTKLAKALRRSGHNRQADTVLALTGLSKAAQISTYGPVASVLPADYGDVDRALRELPVIGGAASWAQMKLFQVWWYANVNNSHLTEAQKDPLAAFIKSTSGAGTTEGLMAAALFYGGGANGLQTLRSAAKDAGKSSGFGSGIFTWDRSWGGQNYGDMTISSIIKAEMSNIAGGEPIVIALAEGVVNETNFNPGTGFWLGFGGKFKGDLSKQKEEYDPRKPGPKPPPPHPGTEWSCTKEDGTTVSMSTELTTEALGNKFRAWVLTDPARKAALTSIYTTNSYSSTELSPTGDHTNKWIGQAWKKYGCIYLAEEDLKKDEDDTDTDTDTDKASQICTVGDIIDEADLDGVGPILSPVSNQMIGLYNGKPYFQLPRGSSSEGKNVSGKYVSLLCRDNITNGQYPNFLNNKEQRALVSAQNEAGPGGLGPKGKERRQARRKVRREIRQDRRARRKKRR